MYSADNRAHFCKALYGMCTATQNELKAVMKVSAETGQNFTLKKTSLESTTQDDFQEIKRPKRLISNSTSQAAKQSTKRVPTSAAVSLPTKAVLTRTSHNCWHADGGHWRSNTQQEPEALRKPVGPIMMASTTNLLGQLRDLNTSTTRTNSKIHEIKSV
jgi:hypothetical protein